MSKGVAFYDIYNALVLTSTIDNTSTHSLEPSHLLISYIFFFLLLFMCLSIFIFHQIRNADLYSKVYNQIGACSI